MNSCDGASVRQVALPRRRVLEWLGLGAVAAVGLSCLAGCVHDGDVVVTGTVSADRASAYRDMVLAAIPKVESLWGEGSVTLPVHIDLPSTTASWAAATGHRPQQRGYAASTVRTDARSSPVRIVMHPNAWAELSPQGREAVVTHEVAHLAMGPGASAPWWVQEGLAEYTAHRDATVPIAQIAGSALEQVAHDPGESWPEPSTQGDAWPDYARAWLACVFIAERHSEDVLSAMFDSAAAGQPTPVWMKSVLSERSEDLHRAWVTWLRRQ